MIDKRLCKKIAANARLELSEEEVEKFTIELKEILKAFSELDGVDISNTSMAMHPIKLKNVLREDKKEECLSQDRALENTRHKKDGYFKGPRAV